MIGLSGLIRTGETFVTVGDDKLAPCWAWASASGEIILGATIKGSSGEMHYITRTDDPKAPRFLRRWNLAFSSMIQEVPYSV